MPSPSLTGTPFGLEPCLSEFLCVSPGMLGRAHFLDLLHPPGSYSLPVCSMSFLSSEVGFDGDIPVRTECSEVSHSATCGSLFCFHLLQPLKIVAEDIDL